LSSSAILRFWLSRFRWEADPFLEAADRFAAARGFPPPFRPELRDLAGPRVGIVATLFISIGPP